jgi:glycopeptide antibiotics resistance protein
MSIKEKLSKIDKTKASKILFALVFILSCLTMNSSEFKGYNGSCHGTAFMFFKFAMIIIFVSWATLENLNNVEYITKTVSITLLTITPILIFDYYVTQISGNQLLYRVWWIAYIMTAGITVFLTLTIFKANNFKYFYYVFWKSFTPLYFFTLIIEFLRKPGVGLTTNYKLFNGTFIMLKAIIKNPNINFEPYLLFFGNIIIFIPLPLILSAFLKKIKPYQLILIGLAVPFIVEGYQYVFKCGDVDIDDIVLNWFGYFIGMILYLIIKKRLLEKE